MKSRIMRWAGHVDWIGEAGNAYNILIDKRERKRPLGTFGMDGNVTLECVMEIG
jgi:hypothetical protein